MSNRDKTINEQEIKTLRYMMAKKSSLEAQKRRDDTAKRWKEYCNRPVVIHVTQREYTQEDFVISMY